MAESLYPDVSGATKNRCAITPTRAVILHAYERGWRDLILLKRFKEEKPKLKKPANLNWMFTFIRQSDEDGLYHLSALVLFMAQTGARVSEAINVTWEDVNIVEKRINLQSTKTETNSLRYLSDELTSRIQKLEIDKSKPIFKYTSRHSVSERIKAVCVRAKIPYKSPHLCGRHTFATTSLELGASIKDTMTAGGWKSSKVFLETYAHSQELAGRQIAEKFNYFHTNRL